MLKYKSIKTYIELDYSCIGLMVRYTQPKYKLYVQKKYLFGLIKSWEFRRVLSTDPKNIFNVVESNY